mmetsp:Transcript_58806/g.132493  ORF Transcript_58806/g.132493 Transcript_58806/m.132493 type:complete len:178 (-) Transcript_58806:108-641(-)
MPRDGLLRVCLQLLLLWPATAFQVRSSTRSKGLEDLRSGLPIDAMAPKTVQGHALHPRQEAKGRALPVEAASLVRVSEKTALATNAADLDWVSTQNQPASWSVSYLGQSLSSCRYIFGVPKFVWALLCDVLALALVLLCIPLLLTCSRRRPPGAPLFDCGFAGIEQGAVKQAPWMSS